MYMKEETLFLEATKKVELNSRWQMNQKQHQGHHQKLFMGYLLWVKYFTRGWGERNNEEEGVFAVLHPAKA